MEQKQNKLEVSIQNSLMLRESMKIISGLVSEGTFVFKKNYLELVALTENNVVMLVFRLLTTAFKDYKIEEEQTIHLNFKNFYDIIKNCKDESLLKISVQESTITILVETQGQRDKEFEITLIEFTDDNKQSIPNLDYGLKIVMGSLEFSKAIKDLFFVEEAVTFNIEENKFIIEGKTNTMKGKVDLTNKIQIKQKDDKAHSVRYTIEYLKKFTDCDKFVNNVELYFKTDFPLKLEYKIVDKLLLCFIMAPRGDED